MTRKKIFIFGIPIDCFNKTELLRYIGKKINGKTPLLITTVNTEFAYAALLRPEVLAMLNNSSLNLADGVGILWASKYLSLSLPKQNIWRQIVGFFKLLTSLSAIIFYPKYIRSPIPSRISGADLIWDLAKFAEKENLKIFLLGAQPTVAEQAALYLQTGILNLKVAGTYSGSPKIEDEDKIVKIIKKTEADILFVAYNVPAEELWLERNLKKTGVKLGIGVGGTFDFLAGRKKRAPKFLQKIGLEWFWRLISEPKRINRQFALPKFVWQVFKALIDKKNTL